MCLEKSISFILAVCYQPPNTNAQSRQQFADAFSNALNLVLNDPDRIVIVTGDFNDLTLDKPIHLQSTFVRIMYSCGFHLLIQNPTRRNHILDWFLTNKPSFAFSSSVLSPIFNLDHCPIYLDLRFNSPSDYHMVNSSTVWDYSAADFEGLNSALFSIPWDFIVANSSNIDIALDNITDVINQCAELHIPTKTVRHFRKHDKPWMTNDLKRLIRQRSKVFSRWRKTDDVRCKIKYNKLRNLIQRKIRVAKSHNRDSILQKLNSISPGNPFYWKLINRYWNSVKSCNFPLIANGKTIYDPYEKCNLFNTHFSSVSTLPDEKLRNVNLPNFSFTTDQRLQSLVVEPFDVYSVLSNLNPAKCKGFKNLPNRLLKSCSQSLATPLSLLFNFILASEQFPLLWKTASITRKDLITM